MSLCATRRSTTRACRTPASVSSRGWDLTWPHRAGCSSDRADRSRTASRSAWLDLQGVWRMSSPKKPTKEAFAQIMLAAIRKHDAAPLHYDPEEFRLVEEGEPKYFLNLSNAYREYCDASSPSDAENTVERYCSVWRARRASESAT